MARGVHTPWPELRRLAGSWLRDAGRVRIPGHAVHYVCEDVHGTCLYRRRDLEVEIDVAPAG